MGVLDTLSGPRHFSGSVFNVEIDKDDKDDPEESQSQPRRNARWQRQTKLPEAANVHVGTMDEDDDEPVPEIGLFDGGAKMWRKWEAAKLPLTSYRKWRREHDDEFCLEEEEEMRRRQSENPE